VRAESSGSQRCGRSPRGAAARHRSVASSRLCAPGLQVGRGCSPPRQPIGASSSRLRSELGGAAQPASPCRAVARRFNTAIKQRRQRRGRGASSRSASAKPRSRYVAEHRLRPGMNATSGSAGERSLQPPVAPPRGLEHMQRRTACGGRHSAGFRATELVERRMIATRAGDPLASRSPHATAADCPSSAGAQRRSWSAQQVTRRNS